MNSYTTSEGPPSRTTYQRSSSIINEETEINDPPPSRSNVALRTSNDEEEPLTESERNLQDSAGHGPSFTGVQRAVVNSITSGNGSMVGSDYYALGGSPDVDVHVHANISNTSHQDNSYFTSQQDKPPGISGQVHNNRSETGGPSVADNDDQEDNAGISMVRIKYKEVDPTAYYMEK